MSSLPKADKAFLVVGECGDGKSTLINHLKNRDEPEAATGRSPNGVTKQPGCYKADIRGQSIALIDTSGVGDGDVHIGTLVGQVELALGKGLVDGVIVCSQIAKNRVTMGARVVQQIVDLGIVSPDKWTNIILCGTQCDRSDEDEITNFRTDTLAAFNRCVQGGAITRAVITSSRKEPYFQELEMAIAEIPSKKLQYCAPDQQALAAAISDITGTPMTEIVQKVEEVHHHHHHHHGPCCTM